MKTKLQSGQTYSLSELFCKDRKIIIPDLQRDYCWGDRSHGENKIELVSGFIDSLFEAYKGDLRSTLQMGMIYAYENPVNHIQLCDGQQRITTLYLLMGMLYKITKSETIKKCLISDFELNYDDKEPYLQYAIRESTLYFLSDLVCEFFLKNKNDVTQIKQTSWYFSEYNLDPTIQGMISGLDIIENKLKGQSVSVLSEFSTFLLQNIKFFYFDMVNRQHGEEMFVVINTTGEPLTATENLKPALIGNIENEENKIFSSNLWEKWEKWFWQNRLENENEADSGLNDFLNWYWQIKLKQENDWSSGKQEKLSPIKLFKERPVRKNESEDSEYSTITYEDWDTARSIEEVDRYFSQLTILYKYFENDSYFGVFQSIQKDATNPRELKQVQILQVIIPLLEYMVRFPASTDSHLHFLRRLRKNYFDGLKDWKWKERNENYIDWRHILQIIEICKTVEDVFVFEGSTESFRVISNVKSNFGNWYNGEEKLKNKLKKENLKMVHDWEDYFLFMGDLSPLFKAALIKSGNFMISNSFDQLNIDFDKIEFTDQELRILSEQIKIEVFSNLFAQFNTILGSTWFSVLEIRFKRNKSLWSGSWSFSRENHEHLRWHEKQKLVIYQNWFYYVIGSIEFSENVDNILKQLCTSILAQTNKLFFDTNLENNFIINGEKTITEIENKLKLDNKSDFYFWLGYLWRFILAQNEPDINIKFEIIFDVFDRNNENTKYHIGNQFVWSKEYNNRSIDIHDEFDGVSWTQWKSIEKNYDIVKALDFIERKREYYKKHIPV